MNSKRTYQLMIIITVLCGVATLASVYIAQNFLHKKSDKLVAAKLENRILEEQANSLGSAKKTLEKYSELNTIARSIVPQEKDQAKTVREIAKISNDVGIKLSTISFPTSNLGLAGNNNTISQAKTVKGIPGLYVVEITVQQDPANPATYNQFIEFLSRLENNRRTAQVTSITIQPLAQNRDKLTFSLILNTYLKP